MRVALKSMVIAAVGVAGAVVAHAQAPEGAPAAPAAVKAPADIAPATREERLRKILTGVRLVGRFTIDGPPGTPVPGERELPREEEYAITAVTKLGDGDWWTVLARIRFGKVDLTLPVPVEVKWAGETPVITLDKATLPGLGTFSSRVVLDGDRYAGTWQHDAVGGHMFGRIVAAPAGASDGSEPKASATPQPPAPAKP